VILTIVIYLQIGLARGSYRIAQAEDKGDATTAVPLMNKRQAWSYAVIGDQSSGLKSRQRSCSYTLVALGSSVW